MNKQITPLKSIRKYCLECSNGNANEVRLCPITDCPLFSYRFGKNPNRKGISGASANLIPKTASESKDFENKEARND